MSTATRRRPRRLLAPLLALALAEAAAGCGGAQRPPPAAVQAQQDLVRSGSRALAKGDLPAAIAAQERALLAARSIEDETGIALRILDLSALHRAAGDPLAARAALDELLAEPPPLAYPGRWRAEAALRAGLLALDAGDAAGGARWAERALALCDAAKCPRRGAIVNLQARAALLAGDPEGAIRRAGQARSLNRSAGDDAEAANSARIAADAEIAVGRHAEAARDYAAALGADKKLGLDAKIFADLVGLAAAARGQGKTGEARGYLERARAVAGAAGDEEGAARAAALLEELAAGPAAPR